MQAIRNILSVALYERLLLLRSIRFRILGGIGIGIPVLIGVGMAVLEGQGVEFGATFGAGAFIPFYVYSYLQAVVIAFVVGDFRGGDVRAQVDEVIASRPLSTTELVVGKYLGVVGALLTLTLGVLLLTLAIQAAKISLLGTPFSLKPYAVYLFLMTVPALLYMAALTFLLGAVLRRQTAVTLVAIAYALAVLFFLGERYGGIFDFGAFSAPLFYSDLIGLGDVARVVEQRLFYLALALGFLGLSIGGYPRLTQSVAWTWGGRAMAAGGLAVAGGLYLYMEAADAGRIDYRREILEIETRYAGRPAPALEHMRLEVALWEKGVPLQGRAVLGLANPHEVALDTLILSLNPGLKLTSVQSGAGVALEWRRELSVLQVVPSTPLAAGGRVEVALEYAGDIDRQGFDLLRDETRLDKSKWPFIKGDLTAWIRAESVFLPGRSRWHPGVGVGYGHDGPPPLSFFTADVEVSLPAGLEAVTQGQPGAPRQQGGRRHTVWKVESAVPFLSLNAGRYEVFAAEIQGIDCAFYVHPDHAGQAQFFADADTLVVEALGQLLDAMEQETGLPYPYARLALVEVPFVIQWYYEGWDERGGLVQPGVLMIEEDVLMGHRLRRDFERRLTFSRGNTDEGQIKRDLLVQAVFNDFLASEGGRSGLFRSPLAQLWSFDRSFGGDQAALVERGLPLFLQEDASADLRSAVFSRGGRRGGGRGRRAFRPQAAAEGAPSWDTLVVAMQQQSLAEMDPDEDPGLYRAVFKARSQTFFRMIEAVLGEEGFVEAVADFGADKRYGEVTFEDFEKAVVPEGKENLQRLVHEWIHGTHVPGYTLTRATARKVDDGWGMVVYQVIVRVRNGEPGRGLVQIDVAGRGDQVTKTVEIEGGQEVEVSMVLWERPFRVLVEPFLAKNQRPLIAPLRIPERVYEGVPESYVRPVAEDERFVAEIIVDNDDEGFTMPVRRVQRYLRPQLKGDNWQVGEFPFAFGRYATSYRWKEGGDGAQPAVWKTRLPQAGEYDVAYYFVPSRFGRRFGLRLAERFTLSVFHGDEVEVLDLESENLEGGWNLLGRFRFAKGEEARVELSDQAGGRLYADAVRWRFVDPDNPEEVYEEDVAAWGNFGRRGGRGGRGGRPGGEGGVDMGRMLQGLF